MERARKRRGERGGNRFSVLLINIQVDVQRMAVLIIWTRYICHGSYPQGRKKRRVESVGRGNSSTRGTLLSFFPVSVGKTGSQKYFYFFSRFGKGLQRAWFWSMLLIVACWRVCCGFGFDFHLDVRSIFAFSFVFLCMFVCAYVLTCWAVGSVFQPGVSTGLGK